MVQQMTDVYTGLSTTRRPKALFTAVGMYGSTSTAFCKGAFGAIGSSSWFNGWGLQQRDVVVLYKNCAGAWKTYCTFSMNQHAAHLGTVVAGAFALTEACSTAAPTAAPSPVPTTPGPTATPTKTPTFAPVPAGTPTAAPTASPVPSTSTRLIHSARFGSLTAAQWRGVPALRAVYATAYGIEVGLYDNHTYAWRPGTFVTTAVTSRRAVRPPADTHSCPR